MIITAIVGIFTFSLPVFGDQTSIYGEPGPHKVNTIAVGTVSSETGQVSLMPEEPATDTTLLTTPLLAPQKVKMALVEASPIDDYPTLVRLTIDKPAACDEIRVRVDRVHSHLINLDVSLVAAKDVDCSGATRSESTEVSLGHLDAGSYEVQAVAGDQLFDHLKFQVHSAASLNY